MGTPVRDTLTDSNWKDLHLHTGEVGATWIRHPAVNSGASRWYIFGDRVHCGVWGNQYASGVPVSADYKFSCTYRHYTNVSSGGVGANLGICVRMSTTDDTYYSAYYQSGELVLIKRVAGVTTSLGTWTSTLTGGGTDYTFDLDATGTAIKAFVNGVERISVTDSSITAVGRAGVRALVPNDSTTGNHIDNIVVTDTSIAATGRSFAVGFVGI